MVFAAGSLGSPFSAPLVGAIAAGLALVAALLNAATGVCPGCEMYLLHRRAVGRGTSLSLRATAA